jgi:hypothetical protein
MKCNHARLIKEIPCDECFIENSSICFQCGIREENIYLEKIYYSETEFHMFCCSCRGELSGLFICENCGRRYDLTCVEYKSIEGDYVCDFCLADVDYFTCDDCDLYFYSDHGIRTNDDNMVCHLCYEDSYFICDDCERVFDNYYLNSMNGCYCDSCFRNHQTDGILPYSFKPNLVFFVRSDRKAKEKIYKEINVIGFENEIECTNRSATVSHLEKINKDLKKDFIYFKEEADCHEGFEIVSHPFSFSWYKEHRYIFDRIFEYDYIHADDELRHGLHISLSKSAYSKTDIFKLCLLIYGSQSRFIKFSKRTEGELPTCNFHPYYQSRIIEWAKWKTSPNRYDAINMTQGNRIELRFYHATHDPVRFKTCLEMSFSFLPYCQETSIEKVIWSDYKRYIKKHTSEYSILSQDYLFNSIK